MSKKGFLLYGNYEEQFKRLSDAQAGKVIKMILYYVNTGEVQESDDALVDMVFSMISFQLAFDLQRYEESCERRREAGRKAGKASAEKRAKAKQEAMASTDVNDCQRFQHDTDTVIDTDTDTVTVTDTDIDTDIEIYNKTSLLLPSSDRGTRGEAHAADQQNTLLRYGVNQHLTTKGVIIQMENFAVELVRKYWGRAANGNDVENVYDKCYMPGTLPNGEYGAVFSPEKAELLRYAFKQAADQNGCTWKYIEGIYQKFGERRIETVEDAMEKEYAWQRGEMPA